MIGPSYKPRILLLTNTLAPYRIPLFNVLSNDFALHVWLCQPKPSYRRWQTDHHNVHFDLTTVPGVSLGRGRSSVTVNPGLGARIRKARVEAIVMGGDWRSAPSLLQAAVAAKLRRLPIVYWSADFANAYHSAPTQSTSRRIAFALYHGYRRLMIRLADSFIAYGAVAQAQLVTDGADPHCIFRGTQVAFDGMLPDVLPDRSRFDVTSSDKVFLYLGYLDQRKGIAHLIRAFRALPQLNVRLLIAGTGPLEQTLRVSAQGDQRIRFVGYVDGLLKAQLYRSADVFVLPTLYDPWPQTNIEAMLAGLPVITTDQDGSVGELVMDGETGIVVSSADEIALQAALVKLAEEDELRIKMGLRAREHVKSFDLDYARLAFRNAVNCAVARKKSS